MMKPEDAWNSAGSYHAYMGRWSSLAARDFVAWLAAPSGLSWLEVGCGTGALTEAVLAGAAPSKILATEPAQAYINHARLNVKDRRVKFALAEASHLPGKPETFDFVVSGLVLNFLLDPASAIREFTRVTKPGGLIAAYVWDYAGEMQFLRRFWDAAVMLDPAALPLDEGQRFPIARAENLDLLFRQADLEQVQLHEIEILTHFRSFEDYWTPFLSGQGPAPGYVSSLDALQGSTLENRLRETLPIRPDGSIHLTARAWAVRGRRR